LGFYEKIISITTKTKRPVIIFPQATRTSVDIKLPFKKGVSKIYEKLNFVCVPVALNSGDVWPKSGVLKANRTITISILNYIPRGLEGDQFLNKIEKDLYRTLDEIR
jgi:1-acyl-sn-glycerol-3-phosphate acyltransferase